VRTSKYTVYNFLVKSLFEQFRRLANIYFLIISILQVSGRACNCSLVGPLFSPGFASRQVSTTLSPTSKYSTVIPLVGVLAVTMCKELYEDLGRHRADQHVNNCKTLVLRRTPGGSAQFVPITWAQLKTGDIIALSNKEAVPADIVILAGE
jgi:phospholipid-transporting ATPase